MNVQANFFGYLQMITQNCCHLWHFTQNYGVCMYSGAIFGVCFLGPKNLRPDMLLGWASDTPWTSSWLGTSNVFFWWTKWKCKYSTTSHLLEKYYLITPHHYLWRVPPHLCWDRWMFRCVSEMDLSACCLAFRDCNVGLDWTVAVVNLRAPKKLFSIHYVYFHKNYQSFKMNTKKIRKRLIVRA